MLLGAYIIYLVVLILIASINYWVGKRDVLYPGFVYSFVWTLVFFAYVFSPIPVNQVGFITCNVLIFGALAFTLGCYFGLGFPVNNNSGCGEVDTYRSYSKYIMFFYCIIIFPFYWRDVMALTGDGFLSVVDIRSAMIKSVMETGKAYSSVLTGSLIYVAINTTFISYIDYSKARWFFYMSLILTLVICVLSTGRNTLTILLSGLFVIYQIKKAGMRFSRALFFVGIPLLIVIALMMGYMFITHVTDDGDIFQQASNFFFIYIIGGIPALDEVIAANSSVQPHHTFQILTQLSNCLLGTNYDIPLPIDEFVYVPFPTNVFTAYKYFIQDFGVESVFIVFLVIGCIYGLIYNKAKKGSKYALFYYAIFIFPLVIGFFDDLFSNFRGHVRDSVFILLSYFLFPRIFYFVRVILLRSKCKNEFEVGI